jgi:hypothetical protein
VTRTELMAEIAKERAYLDTLTRDERVKRLMSPPEGYNTEGTRQIIEAWETHCRNAGHTPASQGGSSTYTRNKGATFAVCDVCDWTVTVW